MTDKQIIIDYKNLCENYSKEVGCYGTFDGSCIKEQCFTYKLLQQLQAKEQECEELNEELYYWVNGEYCDNKCNVVKELDQLKAENDELKRENELAKQLINWILKFFELTDYDWQDDQNEISALIEDYIDDKNSTIDFVNDINKSLFKTLTEIKEIAEKQCVCGVDCIDMKQILQKISEVE